MQLNLVVFLALAVALVLFALQNSTGVTVVFLVWRFDASLALVLMGCVALGALLFALVSLPGSVRGRLRSRQQERRIRELEDTVRAQERAAAPAAVPPLANSAAHPPVGAARQHLPAN